jgi:hypothetical protein
MNVDEQITEQWKVPQWLNSNLLTTRRNIFYKNHAGQPFTAIYADSTTAAGTMVARVLEQQRPILAPNRLQGIQNIGLISHTNREVSPS